MLVFTRDNVLEVGAMRSFLQSHGVSSVIRNEFSNSVMGEVPFTDAWPQLWVEEHQVEQAKSLIAKFDEPSELEGEWECDSCHETSPSTFDLCWSCGSVRS